MQHRMGGGYRAEPPRVPLNGVRMAKKKMWVSHEKARRELGWEPGPADAALKGGGMVPRSGMRLLFVAAYPMEFRGMLERASDQQTERSVCSGRAARVWARTSSSCCERCRLAAGGTCSPRSRHSMPDAIISTGFCGALDKNLQISDIVVGTSISSDGGEHDGLPLTGPPRDHGKVASIDHVAQTSAEKGKLRASGACVVEMEAAGVAERAAALTFRSFVCAQLPTWRAKTWRTISMALCAMATSIQWIFYGVSSEPAGGFRNYCGFAALR